MTEHELQEYLLKNYPQENEKCEWKEFKNLKNAFSCKEKEDVISYVSAISNMNGGELIIGVENETLRIVGTDYSNLTFNSVVATIESAKYKLTELCTFLPSEGLAIEEFVTEDSHKRVWVIHIPKHSPRQIVIAHNKAWQRVGDSLVVMNESRKQAILNEPYVGVDWSAKIIPGATIEDLDPKAILFARSKYKELHQSRNEEIDSWDDITFLNKAHITIQGKITNTAIILLGREESSHFISPAVCQICWKLKDRGDENKDFKVLSIPMILAVEEFQNLVRNANYTFTISGSLYPETMMHYDVFTIREPLCNSIAHQDYSKGVRIEVVEREDESLKFTNEGLFLPSSVEDVVEDNAPIYAYRNPFLVEAMRNVKMVETEGGGIRKLYLQQKKRFFPMPEYDTSKGKVSCTIEGKVIDENFAKILVNNPNLVLADIILLDKVQKKHPITDDNIKQLRKKGFIEGRKPNLFLSAKIAKGSHWVNLKASYVRNRSFDDKYFMNMILEYLKKFDFGTRHDIDLLIVDKLSDVLTDKQKKDKIGNILTKMRRKELIRFYENKGWGLP